MAYPVEILTETAPLDGRFLAWLAGWALTAAAVVQALAAWTRRRPLP